MTAQPDGSFVTEGLPVEVSLPETAEGAVVVSDGETQVSFRLVASDTDAAGAAVELPVETAAGAQTAAAAVTYPAVAEGVELLYEPFVGGVKETAVLAGPAAPRTLVFEVDAPGLTLTADEAGARLVDSGGVVRWVVAPPFMTDAAGVRSEGVSVSVDAAGRLVQSVTDIAWMEDPGRVWPVSVDPTFYSASVVTDCQIHQDGPSLNDCGSATGVVGDDGTGAHRMVFRFDVAGLFDEPIQVINGAQLILTRATSDPGAATASLDLFPLTAPFDPQHVSWEDRTATQPWGTPGGDFGPVEYGTLVPGPGEPTYFSIGRLVQDWVDGAEETGVILSTSDSDFYRFHTAEAADPDTWPAIVLSYNPLFGVKGQYGVETVDLSDRRTAHVNLASGNLTVQELDVDLVGRGGFAAQVSRQYDSRFASRTTDMGGDEYGAWWNAGWQWQVNPSDGTRLEFGPTGDAFLIAGAQHQFFYERATGGYTSAEGQT